LLAENNSKTKIAKNLGVSKATLYKKLRELR
jgi:transcriptional regulator with PAS, ATPase and Fis domain